MHNDKIKRYFDFYLILTFSETCHFSSYSQIFYLSVLMANIFDALGQIISSNTTP